MAVNSGFFNSINGDRRYNAEDMSHYFEGLVSDGVYENIGDKLMVTAGEGMKVVVGTGRALIDCHWVENDEPLEITLNAANENITRHDYVLVTLNLNEAVRSISIYVTNTLPTSTDLIKYLVLADITIAAGATTINQTDIVDLRGTNRCPYVTGLIQQVDTSQLFLQWQTAMEQKYAEFVSWFDTLTEDLLVDTYIEKYQNSYEITSEMETDRRYPIGIEEYNPNKDVLFVYVDGIVLVEGVDISVDVPTVYFPDINGSGFVDASDATAILTAAAHIGAGEPSGLTPEQELLADANMDGLINARDHALVLRYVTATGTGRYANNIDGWTQFLKDEDVSIESSIVPLKNAYRAGSQLTFVVLKSRIGSSTDDSIISRLATIVDVE